MRVFEEAELNVNGVVLNKPQSQKEQEYLPESFIQKVPGLLFGLREAVRVID
jgi:hypothetical protein